MAFSRCSIESIELNPYTRFGFDYCIVAAQKPDGTKNCLTAAWGTLGCYWQRPTATVLIRPHRYTREFLDASDTFSLSFFDAEDEQVTKALWFVGRHSGRDMPDKVEQAGLRWASAENTPTFEEATLVLQCRKMYVAPLLEEGFLQDAIIDERYPKRDYSLQFIGEIEQSWIQQR